MSWEQASMRDLLWEAGIVNTCAVTGKPCRYTPCTVANDVDCCRECMRCGNSCKIARRRKK